MLHVLPWPGTAAADVRERRRAQARASVVRRGLHEERSEWRPAQDGAVGDAVESHASGEAQVIAAGARVEVDRLLDQASSTGRRSGEFSSCASATAWAASGTLPRSRVSVRTISGTPAIGSSERNRRSDRGFGDTYSTSARPARLGTGCNMWVRAPSMIGES
jgi:hypothetical protein